MIFTQFKLLFLQIYTLINSTMCIQQHVLLTHVCLFILSAKTSTDKTLCHHQTTFKPYKDKKKPKAIMTKATCAH